MVQEHPGELFLHYFWLVTSWTPDQLDAEALAEHYRRQGTAEGYLGELVNVLHPALSSSPRPKDHYRGREPRSRYPSGDAFSQNEVLLLLAALAEGVIHAARVVVHGRRVTMVVSQSAAWWWRALWGNLIALRPMAPERLSVWGRPSGRFPLPSTVVQEATRVGGYAVNLSSSTPFHFFATCAELRRRETPTLCSSRNQSPHQQSEIPNGPSFSASLS